MCLIMWLNWVTNYKLRNRWKLKRKPEVESKEWGTHIKAMVSNWRSTKRKRAEWNSSPEEPKKYSKGKMQNCIKQQHIRLVAFDFHRVNSYKVAKAVDENLPKFHSLVWTSDIIGIRKQIASNAAAWRSPLQRELFLSIYKDKNFFWFKRQNHSTNQN